MNGIRRGWTTAVWVFRLGLLVLAGAPLDAAPAQGYRLLVLRTPSGESDNYASAISESGQVVGTSVNVVGTFNATTWNGNGPMYLAPLPTYSMGFAEGINQFGQVVGFSLNGYGTSLLATLWDSAGATPLVPLKGAVSSAALAINDRGQVVGYCQVADQARLATVWNRGVPTVLEPLQGGGPPPIQARAYAINDAGQIVGSSSDAVGVPQATMWNGTTATALSASKFGGQASGINNAGQIVGETFVSPGVGNATLWDGAKTTNLGTLGGSYSYAVAINNAGQVVGASETGPPSLSSHATLWENGKIIDLNIYAVAALGRGTPVTLIEADAINDRGWIAGYEYDAGYQLAEAFVLIPVSGTSQ